MSVESLRKLDERSFVAGQLSPEDLASYARAGVTALVNNRLDGEDYDQPSSFVMASAAASSGLLYEQLPIAGGLSPALIAHAQAVLSDPGRVTIFYCRSGQRSAMLWAAASVANGMPVDEALSRTEAVGFDFRPYRLMLETVAEKLRSV